MLPKDELWQLYRAAYEQYQLEILNSDKAYHRFVNDFFSYHLPIGSLNETDFRLHIMRVFAMKELLEERKDLVEMYFKKDNFEHQDYLKMNDLFNTGHKAKKDNLANFENRQINLITEFANRTSLFATKVTANTVKELFECKLGVPIQATNNRHVALFFGALRDYGLLPFAWQKIIAEHKLISSSETNEPLSASQLRCGLSQAKKSRLANEKNLDRKDSEVGFDSICKEFIRKMKESL